MTPEPTTAAQSRSGPDGAAPPGSRSAAWAPLTEFRGVSKWYGPVIALNDVTLELQPGITGLVGPNGAGKSTLIKLLTGQLRPSLGSVRIRGRKAWSAAAKSHLGYCPDVDAFYEDLSGRAFVQTLARLHGYRGPAARRRTEAVLEQVGMADRAERRLGSYSKGMRQRIKLAQALVHDPELIVLDEPLNGVDPLGRADLAELFRRLASSGKAILISSHILEDMDKLTDRILFLLRGRVMAAGSLVQIRELLDEHPLRIHIGTTGPRELAARLLRSACVQAVELEGRHGLLVQVRRPQSFFAELAEAVVEEGFEVQRLQIRDASAQAVFDYLLRRGGPGP
jgi:ABC-2 type transport system ATP-binding protein